MEKFGCFFQHIQHALFPDASLIFWFQAVRSQNVYKSKYCGFPSLSTSISVNPKDIHFYRILCIEILYMLFFYLNLPHCLYLNQIHYLYLTSFNHSTQICIHHCKGCQQQVKMRLISHLAHLTDNQKFVVLKDLPGN